MPLPTLQVHQFVALNWRSTQKKIFKYPSEHPHNTRQEAATTVDDRTIAKVPIEIPQKYRSKHHKNTDCVF